MEKLDTFFSSSQKDLLLKSELFEFDSSFYCLVLIFIKYRSKTPSLNLIGIDNFQ